MRGKVILEVIHGIHKGKVFAFTEHDVFVFGRDPECHAKLPDDDRTASRHHFVLEVNPPDVRLRDLGSLNGTYINERKFGGRPEWQSPEEADRSHIPEVDLRDGDRLRVGDTEFLVSVEASAICIGCGIEIPEAFKSVCRSHSGDYICPQCCAQAPETVFAPNSEKVLDVAGQLVGTVYGEDRASGELDWRSESIPGSAQSVPIQAVADMLLKKYKKTPERRETGKNGEIPGYRIGRILGQGGMGTVFLAERQSDGAQVAVKVMLSKVAVDAHSREVFLREIETTKNLRHPNIVQLLDYGSAGPGFYFVMEFCEGGSVDDLRTARGGRLSLEETGSIMLQVLEALAFVHQQGFVHRDIKPQNIMLTRNGIAKLGDLGLAKNFEKAGFSGMTLTGSAGGTPLYMPKEQVINFKYVKPVSDVWSLAATMYSMLTGSSPYVIEKGQAPLEAVLKARTIPLGERLPSLPNRLIAVLDRAMALKPENRYQTAVEFLMELRQALERGV
jgi:eukaryotic-like serine/threonine-protein kinase